MRTARWVPAVPLALSGVIAPASAESPAERQLISAYRAAHEAKDVARAMALVYWVGVPGDIRKTLQRNFEGDFQRKLASVEIAPREPNQMTEHTKDGRTYRTNLEVVGNLVVRFVTPQPDGITATTYPVGAHDGRLFIATAVTVP